MVAARVVVLYWSVASCWCWQPPFVQYYIPSRCLFFKWLHKFEVFSTFAAIFSQQRWHFWWLFWSWISLSFGSNPKCFQIKALVFRSKLSCYHLKNRLRNLQQQCHLHIQAPFSLDMRFITNILKHNNIIYLLKLYRLQHISFMTIFIVVSCSTICACE